MLSGEAQQVVVVSGWAAWPGAERGARGRVPTAWKCSGLGGSASMEGGAAFSLAVKLEGGKACKSGTPHNNE